ncbi:hypothetical protein DWV44_13925, partial [Lachnospira eligens]|uniref:hypothetical protein n=1 Tax=Lachnospira eligens TaxID=39485 RepID=UPI000FF236C7
VLRDIESQLEYIKKYPEDMKQIQTNAQQLMTFSIFSDKNSFTYNNIVKTGKDFEKVADVSLYLVNNKAAGSFVNYYYTFYFALIMMVFIIYGLSGERDNGMWGIVHSAGSGRLRLALHRLFIIAGSGVVITAGLYFTTFAAALLLYGGAGALNAPVQSIQAFERFAMPMSQIGFVLYNYEYSVLAVVVLSVALWAVFVVNRKRNHALILTGVVVGLEVLMYYRIGLHSIYSAFKQINIVRLMKVNAVISTYANRGRGSFVISESAIMFWALMVILVVSVAVAVVGTVFMRPSQGKNVLTRLTDKLYAGYQHIFANVPVVFKELHKLLVTSRGFTVIVVLLLVVMYFISYGKMAFSDNSRERDRIYLEKGGADYSQISALIDERRADYMQAVEKSMEASEQYGNGEIGIDELSQINSTVSIYASRYAAVREFEQKREYLDTLKEETGIDGYMMSDRGYEGKMAFSDNSRERDRIYLEKGGADYSQISALIDERRADYMQAVQKSMEASEQYENGEIGIDELSQINSTVSIYASRYASVREFEQKREYLENLKEETGIDGYMMSDRGYEEIFGKYGKAREIVLLMALLASVVLIVSENIGIETSTGTKYIVNAASGKNTVKIKRIAASLALCIVLYFIVYGIDMIYLQNYYGMPYTEAPLMSLTFMRDCGLNISIGTFIVIRLIVRLVMMFAVFAVTYVFSSRFSEVRGRAVSVLIIVAVIVLVAVTGNVSIW